MKLVYPANFYKEEEGYSVEIPDLLGCVTQGNSLEEAMEMAQDKSNHIENFYLVCIIFRRILIKLKLK